jgi:hypothetical protein
MHAINWVSRAIFASLLWFGFVHDVGGARNIALFLVWCGAVLSPLMLTKSAVMDRANRDPDSAIAEHGGNVWRIAVVQFLAWHGALASAIAWALFAVIFVVSEDLANRVREGRGDLPWA